jgi:hypothetical protein
LAQRSHPAECGVKGQQQKDGSGRHDCVPARVTWS